MKHRVGYNRLGRKTSHRKALHRNMATSLFRYERIKTTKAKALEVKRTAEKMITRAKEDSVHNRRIIRRDITDKEILAKLFTDIGPRYKSRPGGYTRILKLGHRKGDAAEMVLLELVEEQVETSGKKNKKSEKKVETKAEPKAETKAEPETVEEEAPLEEAEEKAAEEETKEEEIEEKAKEE